MTAKQKLRRFRLTIKTLERCIPNLYEMVANNDISFSHIVRFAEDAVEGNRIHVHTTCTQICDMFEMWLSERAIEVRRCSVCGKLMRQGYVVLDAEYYCSDECLHTMYGANEYETLYKGDQAYYTEWY